MNIDGRKFHALRAFRAFHAFKDASWKRQFLFWMGAAFALHALAAYFSVGFYHTDEHFQILEFLSYKLGWNSGSELAIEFGAKIRPWFQPGIAYCLARTMQFLGITNPFHWVFVFRALASFLGWLSLAGLAILSYSWFEDPKLRRVALILSATLWYLPALHARFSSESLSGSLFYLAASLLFLFVESEFPPFYLLIGGLFGAAFLFRYQVAFLVIGAFLFYLIRYRPCFAKLAMIATGVLAMVGLGVWVDHWGYGSWTFTPWNYFHYNLVLGHVADVDTQPVWDFFRSSATETFPPLGLLALCGFALGWIFNPLHLLTAISFPLYFIHSIIGHKELRFIFPIACAGPFLLLLSLAAKNRAAARWQEFCRTRAAAWVFKALFAWNIVALIPTTLLPCWMPARLFSQIYDIKEKQSPNTPMEIFYKDKDPFEILGIHLGYYRPPGASSVQIADFQALREKLQAGPVWYFQVGFELPEESGDLRARCVLEAESLPPGFASLIRWGPIRPITHRVTDWTLYRCS